VIGSVSRFIRGFGDVFSAYDHLRISGLWPYLLLSGLISLGLSTWIIFELLGMSSTIGPFLQDVIPWEWAKSFISNFGTIIAFIIVAFIYFLAYRYVILAILSPVMSALSVSFEKKLLLQDNLDTNSNFISELWRGIRISIRNFFKEMQYTILLILASFIPLVSVVTGPATFLVQSYFMGFSSLDYYLERYVSMQQSIQIAKRHRMYLMGTGAAFMVILMIPVLGAFVAPTLATIATTEWAVKNNVRFDMDEA